MPRPRTKPRTCSEASSSKSLPRRSRKFVTRSTTRTLPRSFLSSRCRRFRRDVPVVRSAVGDSGRYAVLTSTSTSTVQGTAFQVRVDALDRTIITTTDGTVRTFGSDAAVPPVLVAAGMQTTVTKIGPSAAEATASPMLTFTFEDADQAFVVNGAGQAAGVREGSVLRYIPGSTVAHDNGKVEVTIPSSDAGRFSSVVDPKRDVAQVHIATEL